MHKLLIILIGVLMVAVILISDSHGGKVHNRDQVFQLKPPVND